MTVPDPYAHATFHGKPLDNATIAALKIAERLLDYELTILQGVGGAAASSGTHTEGRAVDLAPADHAHKVLVLRRLGFAVWHRTALSGVWPEHIHGVLIFESRTNQRGIAPLAFDQIRKYDAGQDGLAGSNRDPNQFRPDPRAVFTLTEYKETFMSEQPTPATNNVTKARDKIVEAVSEVNAAAVYLERVATDRTAAQIALADLKKIHKDLHTVLDVLPKK